MVNTVHYYLAESVDFILSVTKGRSNPIVPLEKDNPNILMPTLSFKDRGAVERRAGLKKMIL